VFRFRYRAVLITVVLLSLLHGPRGSWAIPPKFRVTADGLKIDRVSAKCPIIYDNDWWSDIPDDAYLWAKASLGQCDLRANIVSRDMWE